MTDLELYFRMGIEHITDRNGYDHMLFLVTLCAGYQLLEWRRVLLLATAFTLGHSVTLLLTAFGYRIIDAETVEILIPITIFLTAAFNFLTATRSQKGNWGSYGLALGFGLVHGMGFAGFFTDMLSGIREDILLPLLYFNVGLEVGQLLIVLIFLVLSWLVLRFVRISPRLWTQMVSGLGMALSLLLLAQILF